MAMKHKSNKGGSTLVPESLEKKGIYLFTHVVYDVLEYEYFPIKTCHDSTVGVTL